MGQSLISCVCTMSELPHEELSQEETELLKKFLKTPPLDDYIRYPHGPVVMPRTYLDIAERIRNFEVKEDDIWIVTYPKSGTTWTQEMVWQIVNNVDKEKGRLPLFTRTPFLEFHCITKDMPFGCPPEMPKQVADMMQAVLSDPIVYTSNLTGRRVIKCHMPMEMQPKDLVEKCKVIYVARNIKDVAVSWFHHLVNMTPHDFQGSFEDHLDLIEKDLHMYGSYFHHVLGGWALKDHPNMRFMWYEDMKKDIRKEVLDTCKFIDHQLTPEKLDALLEHISVGSMKNNPAVNMPRSPIMRYDFIRKGVVGDHKNVFSEERQRKWNNWIKEKLENTGLVMPGI